MRISNNLMAYNAQNKLNVNNNNVADSVRKLSSGLKISRAGDDAAGLAISEKMRAQIQGLDMASKNSQDGISLIQTAEGALNETHSILQRMRELSVQSASDTNVTEDREALDKELEALIAEIDDIASLTTFNGQELLDGSFGASVDQDVANSTALGATGVLGITGSAAADTYTLTDDGSGNYVITGTGATNYVGAVSDFTPPAAGETATFELADLGVSIEINSAYVAGSLDGLTVETTGNVAKIQSGSNYQEQTDISIGDMSASALGVDTLDITTREGADAAITALDTALETVSTERADLGAMQNRLEHKILNLDTSSENLQAAESRIRDLDMAAEMTEFTSNNILSQAATSMLAQANSLPQNVLKLLG